MRNIKKGKQEVRGKHLELRRSNDINAVYFLTHFLPDMEKKPLRVVSG